MPTIDVDDSSDGDNDADDEQLTLSATYPHVHQDPTEVLVDVVSHPDQTLIPADNQAATLRIPPRGSSTLPLNTTVNDASFGFSDAGASRRMDSDHNLAGTLASSSASTSTTATTTTQSPSTNIPALGPPWELRMRNNNAGWYYFNTVTGDVKTDRSLQQQQQRDKERHREMTTHPAATGYAYQPVMAGSVNGGTSGSMTRATSEPFNLAAAAATSSFPYPSNYPASLRSSSRSATPTPSTTSRRPSTAGSTSGTGGGGGSGSGAGRSRAMADFAEDALSRVFGIGLLGKKSAAARRKSSRASFAEKNGSGQVQSQTQSQHQQQPQYQQHREGLGSGQALVGGLQTRHVNSSISGPSVDGRLLRSSRDDVSSGGGGMGGGKRVSAGSIPARSSSRMSLSYYQQQRQTLVPHDRADAVQGMERLGGGVEQDGMVDVADETPGLFWSGNSNADTTGRLPSQARSAVRRRIMRDQTTLDDRVSRLQAQLALASEAAERHLLALQTPEQSLASLSLPDTPRTGPTAGSSTSPTVRISQTPEAEMLRKQIDSLVPLVRELVYTTRHAVPGLHTTILDTLPLTANSEWTAEHALSFLSSEELHHSQRRLVAALSKIIFFAHSAAGTDWPLGGTAERLALDTRDLGYAVAAYLSEVRVVGCMNEQVGQGLKQPFARFGDGEEEEEEQLAVNGPFWQPFDPLGGDHVWKELDRESERALNQLVDGVKQSLLSLQSPASYEAAQGIGTQLDEIFRFLSDLDILATVDVDEDSLRDITLDHEFEEYLKTVATANAEFSSYTGFAALLQQTAGDLLLHLINVEPTGLADTLAGLPSLLDNLTESVSKLFAISRQQAQLVPIKLSPRIGAQSSSQAEQRQMTTMQNDAASRRSSVVSSASMFTRPATRYHNTQDSSQFFPNSYSTSSIPAQSISRTASLTAGSRMSASSSVSSLHTDEQFGYNFSRNSVGVYGRPSTDRSK